MPDGLAWLNRRQRDGGIDHLPLPDGVPGAMWLCGKHAIGPDHERAIAETGAEATVVCLVERHELVARYDRYLDWLGVEHGRRAIWWPIADLHAPSLGDAVELAELIVARLRAGDTVLLHCAAGIGRTGTIAVCVLLLLGEPLEVALRAVHEARPGAGPEVGAQRELVETFATRHHG